MKNNRQTLYMLRTSLQSTQIPNLKRLPNTGVGAGENKSSRTNIRIICGKLLEIQNHVYEHVS